ncbi:DUF4265 domain-containing protein [Acinetobacter venetianus]|uniref:DUF4265 domain-containing protein n=1 Tax=Acinetobacter venetianus TaxID=52133 RepID=A0A150HW56_9GAMM|nr:DUF4265 domain-containing protein [Acinetobacter venetianus]KXZ71272.1 hypothetical protein AVENLUH13518_01359 [Acinetobacter venetianus]
MCVEKIIVDYFDKNNKELAKEIIWGEKFDDNQYFVRSIPFFIPNIAFDDLIEVEKEDEIVYFSDLIKVSNNSTVRVIFFEDDPKGIDEFLKGVESYSSQWEKFTSKPYYAINVPKEVNYKTLKTYLEKYERGFFDYEESCLSEKHSNDLL